MAAHAQTPTLGSAPLVTAVFPSRVPFDVGRSRFVQECLAGTRIEKGSVTQYWRGDTIYGHPLLTPAAVITLARQCLTQFPIATIDPFELPTMMKVAMQAGDTAAIHAVLKRQLAAITSVHGRAVLVDSMVTEIKRRMYPIPLEFVRELVAELDHMGTDAVYQRGMGHLVLAQVLIDLGSSPDSILAEYTESLTLLRQVPPEMTSGLRRQVLEGSVATLIPDNMLWWTFLRDGTETSFQQWTKASATHKPYLLIGKRVPPINGEDWFGTPGNDGDDGRGVRLAAPKATSGAISIVGEVRTEHVLENARCFEMMRRVHGQFPAVSFILMTQTQGFFRDVGMPDPAQETSWLGHYFLDSLQLPGVLNITRSQFDTTRTNEHGDPLIYTIRTHDAWLGLNGCTWYVLDRQGRVVNLFMPFFQFKELSYVLTRLLQFSENASSSTH